jgi:glutamyl-tRNA reductase
MSVLVVGLSHRSAPVAVLEHAAISGDAVDKLLCDVFRAEHVAGTFVVSTCNRVEVYAEVSEFHAGVTAICELLARHAGTGIGELTPHLYVYYDDRAAQHLLSVTCGLDSLVVGDSQILGQVRRSLALARRHGTLGHALDDLGALALRAARRARTQTGIGRAGVNWITVGVGLAAARIASPPGARNPARPLSGLNVVVVGAGSLGSLAVATAARLEAARIVVVNRTKDRAERLAASVRGSAVDFSALGGAIATADLVISCIGSTGLVITADMVTEALRLRAFAGGGRRPLVLLDLALPHDVDAAAGRLPGVSLIGLDSLQEAGTAMASAPAKDVAAVRAIVAEELSAWASMRHAARVTSTVVALRAKAGKVVEAELARLAGRLGELDDQAHAEIAQAMDRVVGKLLHAPTVRVKELAGSPGGDSYETALRVLFDLDPRTVDALTRAEPSWGGSLLK